MDADLSHDPIYIPKFIQKINRGFDVVVGSRRMEGEGCWLELVSKLISWGWEFYWEVYCRHRYR